MAGNFGSSEFVCLFLIARAVEVELEEDPSVVAGAKFAVQQQQREAQHSFLESSATVQTQMAQAPAPAPPPNVVVNVAPPKDFFWDHWKLWLLLIGILLLLILCCCCCICCAEKLST